MKQHIPDNLCSQELKEAFQKYSIDHELIPPAEHYANALEIAIISFPSSAQLILTTPEKWDSITRKWTENFFVLASVKLMLVDEVHLLGDESRGSCLEAIMSRMKSIQRAATSVNVSQDQVRHSRYARSNQKLFSCSVRITD